jgi:hypothetical protein
MKKLWLLFLLVHALQLDAVKPTSMASEIQEARKRLQDLLIAPILTVGDLRDGIRVVDFMRQNQQLNSQQVRSFKEYMASKCDFHYLPVAVGLHDHDPMKKLF